MSVHHVRRCLVCGDAAIDAKPIGRVVRTACLVCGAVLIIEFDPPDERTLRARIERIDAADAERSESHPDTRTTHKHDIQKSPVVRVASRRR